MNLASIKYFNPDFDPSKFNEIPDSRISLLDGNRFSNNKAHQEYEAAARELIRSSISESTGKRVISREEAAQRLYGDVGEARLQAIAKGEIIIR